MALPPSVPDRVTTIAPPGPPDRPKPKNGLPKPGKERVELKQRRTPHSRKFLNPDGTFRVEITPRPIHYKDRTGNWVPIENELVPTDEQGYAYRNKGNAFEALFATNPRSGKLVRFGVDAEHWVAFSPADRPTGTGVVQGAQITYKAFRPGADLRYTVDGDQVKEEIILHRRPQTNTFVFSLTTQGVIHEQDSEGNTWFKDESSGERLFAFGKPFAEDAAESLTEAVSLSIRQGSAGEELLLTVDDTDWLKNAKYPVVIDPTARMESDASISRDTYVAAAAGYESKDSSLSQYLHVGAHPIYGRTRAFLRFPYLPGLPAGAKITNAYIDLNMYMGVDPADGTQIGVHQVTSDWTPGKTTWGSQPGYNPTPEATLGGSTIGWWHFPIRDLAKKWYEATVPNYGVMLKAVDESRPRRSFYSGNSTDQQPTLVVEYGVEPVGVEEYWGYAGNVNVHNGNLVFSATDVTLPGRGIPISITRTYNSRASSPADHPYGYGWQYNAAMRLGSPLMAVWFFPLTVMALPTASSSTARLGSTPPLRGCT